MYVCLAFQDFYAMKNLQIYYVRFSDLIFNKTYLRVFIQKSKTVIYCDK